MVQNTQGVDSGLRLRDLMRGRSSTVADLEEAKRLAAEFEAMGGGAFTMVLAQMAEHGDHLREC